MLIIKQNIPSEPQSLFAFLFFKRDPHKAIFPHKKVHINRLTSALPSFIPNPKEKSLQTELYRVSVSQVFVILHLRALNTEKEWGSTNII